MLQYYMTDTTRPSTWTRAGDTHARHATRDGPHDSPRRSRSHHICSLTPWAHLTSSVRMSSSQHAMDVVATHVMRGLDGLQDDSCSESLEPWLLAVVPEKACD